MNDKLENENVPSTNRLNFGQKTEETTQTPAEDIVPVPDEGEDTGAVSPLNDPAGSTQMDAVEEAADDVETVETPETPPAEQDNDPEPEQQAETAEAANEGEDVAAVAEDEDAASEPEADQEVEQVEPTETEAETEFEPEIVTGEGEDDDGPVEIEIEAPAATTDGDDDKSVEELTAERERLDNEIKSKTDAQKTSVINQIKTVVETYAITTEELVEALGGLKSRRKGVKAKQKYADPASGATWSGRGKEPAWIKGKDRKKFLIPEDQQTVNP